MYKLLAIILVSSLLLLLTGCDKPQWIVDEELAYSNCDTLIKTSEGKYYKTYYTKNSTIVFNSTNTCITFTDLLTKSSTTACGTFTIKAKPINYKE